MVIYYNLVEFTAKKKKTKGNETKTKKNLEVEYM